MSTQERVNQLANAALRSMPIESNGTPKPATYMPSFEQMRAAAPVLPVLPKVSAPAARINIALSAFDLAFSSTPAGH